MKPGTRFIAKVIGDEHAMTCVMLEHDQVEVITEVERRTVPLADLEEGSITDKMEPSDPELEQ